MQQAEFIPGEAPAGLEAGRAKSLATRQAQAEVKRQLSAGTTDFGTAWFSEAGRGMKVRALLLALPGVGQRKADSLLKLAGIDSTRRVRQVGPVQFSKLIKYLQPQPVSEAQKI